MSGGIKIYFSDGYTTAVSGFFAGAPADAAVEAANNRAFSSDAYDFSSDAYDMSAVVIESGELTFVNLTPTVRVEWDADDAAEPENQHEEDFLARVKAAVAEGGE